MTITILAILITWYLTKLYYTRSPRVKMAKFDNASDLLYEKCSMCSQIAITDEENLRVPFYCSSCR
jgi:hypothetical protein